MRILLVEDDVVLGDGIRTGLIQEGYIVDWVKDGIEAKHTAKIENFDLMILDLGLPGCPGIEVLKELRSSGSDLAVLILTARDSISDRVNGLDCGADDYLTKPFDLDELSARLRVLLRRKDGRSVSLINNGDLVIDPSSRIVTLCMNELDLSLKEFSLLEVLASNSGRVMSRTRLEDCIYGWDAEIGSNALEVHVHHLRKKLGDGWIKTVRGVGYLMEKRS